MWWAWAARSTIIRETQDFSTAVFDATGRLAAQSEAIPLHLNSLGYSLSFCLKDYPAGTLEADELEPEPVLDTLRTSGRDILVGAFVPLACYALFHLVTVFPVSWISLFTGRSVGEFLMVQLAGAAIAAITIVMSGQIGRAHV